MSLQFRNIQTFTAAAMVLAFSADAQAQASRTFVSTTGSDANVAVNCSATANCRTFGAALSVTNPGGEIVVVTSGGYGPATIAQPVVITAIGVDASVSVTTSGANGLNINAAGNVTITGLNLHGEQNGADGILVQEVTSLRLYNMLIENFTGNGINFNTSGTLAIYGSAINDNTNGGLVVQNASATAYVRDTSFDNDLNAVAVTAGQVTVVNSNVQNNFVGFQAGPGTLKLFNDEATFNSVGLQTNTGGTLYFANCFISDNATAYNIATGTTMAGTNPGSSFIDPSQSLTGTLATAVNLK